jgi:arsenate reductase (thioredoxin)
VKKKKEAGAGVGPRTSSRTQVLFVCIGNACRSPMAEAIARYDAADVIEPHSAGMRPMGHIADLTKQTLERNGYSPDGLTSDALTKELADAADIIINMTGKQREDAFWDLEKVEDWMVQDPYGQDSDTYQRVLESIKRRVNQLADGLREKRENKRAGK